MNQWEKRAQRIEPLFEYDTKNGISFWVWFKESNSFLNTTQRMKRFFEYDSMNRTLFLIMTQWIEPSLTWLEKCFFLKKNKELKFLEHESKNWIFEFFEKKKKPSKNSAFLKNTIQRTELFANMTQNFFFQNMIRRISPFILPWLKDFFFFLKKKTQRIRLFFWWLTDLNLFVSIFFQKKKMTQRIDLFFELWLSKCIFFEVRMRLTEHFFQYYSQNWFFFWMWLFSWHWTCFLNSTQRIEVLQYDSEE